MQVGDTYGDEEIRDLLLILCPCLSILGTASLDISGSTMGDHGSEEDGIEPREGAGESSNQAPVDSEVEITSVVDFSGVSV